MTSERYELPYIYTYLYVCVYVCTHTYTLFISSSKPVQTTSIFKDHIFIIHVKSPDKNEKGDIVLKTRSCVFNIKH